MDVIAARRTLVASLFPQGIPHLWCPLLTHFRADGELDAVRIRRQLQAIATHVRGLLVPGSTGEGWEMTDQEVHRLLEVTLDTGTSLD